MLPIIKNIDFIKQQKVNDCWPTALKTILWYFWKNININSLYMLTSYKWNNIATINIAIASAILWHETIFYTKNLSVNWTKEKVEEAKNIWVEIGEKSLELDEIIDYINKDYIPVVLVDWNIITWDPNNTTRWHFVPVVWYSDKNIYIHSHWISNPDKLIRAYMPVKKDIFEKARKAEWTDEDILLVHKKDINIQIYSKIQTLLKKVNKK